MPATPQQIAEAEALGYAKYSEFANSPLALSNFTPEVVEALKYNDKGGKNVVYGGELVKRDPNFMYTPTSPIVTSTPVRDEVNTIGQDISTRSNNVPTLFDTQNLAGQKNDINSFYNERRTELQKRRDEEVARITAEYDALEKKTKEAQVNETGSTTRNLLMIGGGLGGSASQQGALLKLEAAHRDEMTALVGKRNSAIALAQNAFNDKDFALAEAQMKEVRDLDKDIYQRNKDFLSYTLDLRRESRADEQFAFDREQAAKVEARDARDFALANGIEDPFYLIAGVGYDSSTGEKLNYDQYIERGGKPDFSNAFVVEPGSKEAKEYVRSLAEKYPDAGITLTDDPQTAQGKLQNSKLYRKDTYIAPKSSSTKLPPLSIRNKYDLPSNVTDAQWNAVSDAVSQYVKEQGGIGNMTQDQKYQAWDEISAALADEKINAQDYDGLLWELFHPEGLDGYFKQIKGVERDKSGVNVDELIEALNNLPSGN